MYKNYISFADKCNNDCTNNIGKHVSDNFLRLISGVIYVKYLFKFKLSHKNK